MNPFFIGMSGFVLNYPNSRFITAANDYIDRRISRPRVFNARNFNNRRRALAILERKRLQRLNNRNFWRSQAAYNRSRWHNTYQERATGWKDEDFPDYY